MTKIDIGGIGVNYLEWGRGDRTVVFIHGNLASAGWFRLAAPLVPEEVRVVAFDWRGCGESDKLLPTPGYENYRISQLAEDILSALAHLGIGRCDLATHSTGGLISTHLLLAEPHRFGKVLAVSPVGPMGLRFPPESTLLFQAMKASRQTTRKALALTAATLFHPETLVPGQHPVFAEQVSREQRDLFEHLVDQAFAVSDGIRFGIPFHLNAAWQSGALRDAQQRIRHPHLILWGALDPFIPRADMEEMAARMPDCRLVVVPDVGHSLLIERPDIYARYFAEMFAPEEERSTAGGGTE